MTKRERVEQMLIDAGFTPTGDFMVTKGPKVKLDILECWNVGAEHNGRHVEIYSAYTMTDLVKTGLVVVPNYRETCLYGDYVAEPRSK